MHKVSLSELASANAKILHISDLHFGMNFDEDSWSDLVNIAGQLRPHILLVTGDLVNSPHRVSLRRAFNQLNVLEEALKAKVIVVPGNHDTRFLGLLPIKWINPFALLVLTALSFAAYWFAFLPYPQLWLFLAIALIALFFVRCLFIDFTKKFRKFILPRPGFYAGQGFEIYAFDSASQSLFGARGRIPKRQFVDAQGNLRQQLIGMQTAASSSDKSGPGPAYRIAILHHHPMPIPYDDANEPLMVADNAGTFLSEVSKLGVRLILHGHKHHKHFSRTTINAGTDSEHEVAVLSAGTPTRGAGTDRLEHHFYFLRLVGPGDVEVTPFIALRGGAFEAQDSFAVEPSSMADQRLYEGTVQHKGKKSDVNVLTVEISPDGDLDYRREFYGLQVFRDQIESITQELELGTGHIDDFSAGSLEPNPRYQIRMQQDPDYAPTLTHRKGGIVFGRKLNSKDPPVDFYSHYYACNAFAMSVQQHEQMYTTGAPHTESIQLELQGIPAGRLDIVVKFPAGFKIAGTPALLLQDGGIPDRYFENKFGKTLAYYPHLNVAMIRIPYPPLRPAYLLQWTLTKGAPPAGGPSVIGGIEALAQALLKNRNALSALDEVIQLFELIDESVREEFGLELRSQDHLDISLMVYDKLERALQIVAANFGLTEAMAQFKLKYGDGIAGRAYKMNRGRMFIKRLALDKNTPSYYYPVDGQPYELNEISEEVIISLPLRHPENEQLVYAVLNLSSSTPGSRLQDVKEPRILEEYSRFLEVISLACFDTLSESILFPGA